MPGGAAWACVQVHDGVVMAVHTGTAALSEGSVGQAQASDLQEVRVRVAAQYAASSGRTALAAEAGAGLRRARSKDEQAVLALAERNAAEMARTAALRRSHDPQASARAANELAGVLGMVNAPIRVECWDISHLQGRSPRAGVAVHVDGVARREQFRAYKVPERHGGDDYASMRWLAGRRGPSLDADLVLVDGGPGQVQAVTDVLHDELGLAVAVAGIAKRMEELYLPGQDDPVILSRSSPALWLVQAVRDDAHNTAISAHRKDRDKKLTRDPLLDVPGVGPKLAAAIRRAGVDPSTASEAELASIPGVGTHTAERIVAAMSAPG